MSYLVTSTRYEIKLPCDPPYFDEIESWVRLHPAQWRVAYPPREINNIYFDSADYQGLDANLGGIAERAKLRLRWYGPDKTAVAPYPDPAAAGVWHRPQLELKCKDGMAGWKEINRLDRDFRLDLTRVTWPEARRALRAALASQARLWLITYTFPALINRYRRAYYVTPDEVVRLTIDTALQAYDQRFSARPNLTRPAPIDAQAVIELKAATTPEGARRLSRALADFPVRAYRFSKYVQGMLAAIDV